MLTRTLSRKYATMYICRQFMRSADDRLQQGRLTTLFQKYGQRSLLHMHMVACKTCKND